MVWLVEPVGAQLSGSRWELSLVGAGAKPGGSSFWWEPVGAQLSSVGGLSCSVGVEGAWRKDVSQ